MTKVLHIEPTDSCNAACPQCARETDIKFNKTDLHHLSLQQLLAVFSTDDIKKLDKMFMCGNYGDPAAGINTLNILQYFRDTNPTITLGMNTNGGLRDARWWRTVAQIMHQPVDYPKDYVVFSLDGLEDTNHIYRVNTKWDKIMANAQAFINAGGRAHWEMLVFDYNEHQVDTAQQMAKDMGFAWFRAKVSKRFNAYPVSFLQPPKAWRDPIVTKGHIECQAIADQSVYISAQGILYPCCWMGNTEYTLDTFDTVQQSWTTNTPINTCQQICTKNTYGTSFTNQWQREIEFN